MAEAKAGDFLVCIGCDHVVGQYLPGDTLAISCKCGAISPVLTFDREQVTSTPLSLIQMKLRGPVKGEPAHLEIYLGFSDHESPLKSQLEKELREINCISMRECDRTDCQERYGIEKLRAVY